MDTLQDLSASLPTIDADGFESGRLAVIAINDLNRSIVVDQYPPDSQLEQMQRWRWIDGAWVATIDYRGHAWYDPVATDAVHYPARFDDAPPAGWVYWAPGRNRVVGEQEKIAKQWTLIRSSRDALLSKSDWVVTKSLEQGQPTPPDWVQYRQGLRDITDQADPFNIIWPATPQGPADDIFSVGSM